jgi:hypothetical protein
MYLLRVVLPTPYIGFSECTLRFLYTSLWLSESELDTRTPRRIIMRFSVTTESRWRWKPTPQRMLDCVLGS